MPDDSGASAAGAAGGIDAAGAAGAAIARDAAGAAGASIARDAAVAAGPPDAPEAADAADGADAADSERIRAAFDQMSVNTLPGRMGIKIVEASARRVVGTMPVEGNTQPYGLLHGGASCVLAETLGSLGAALHGGRDRVTVGIEINATHHRGAGHGLVTGVATLLHGGRTLTTYEIVITDELGRRVCTCRLTCLLRDTVPGDGTKLATI
jgi:1,4-dihydroxy-2-naphthoyl-CoA hydrolase